MSDYSNKTVLVRDNSLFLPLARKLSESFGRVLYFTPWQAGFSSIKKACLGDGMGDIERCDDIWKVKKEVDLFVFPDIENSGEQLELESQGYRVWGARDGDQLELDRVLFLDTLKRIGLDVPKFEIVDGMEKLGEVLKDREDCFIKISRFRGDMETTHWRSWKLDEWVYHNLEVKFGPAGNEMKFLLFDPIDTPLEIGGDTYCVDGEWPDTMLHGIEWKDKAYFSSVTKRNKMPDAVQDVLDAFGPVLKKYRYRNQFSMEIRVADDGDYFIDPTCRGGLPSTGSQMELWGNLAEILWEGAEGNLVEPDPVAEFSAEVAITSKAEKGNWVVSEIPPELHGWLKLSGCCEIDGRICFPPDDSHGDEVGWLVAIGDTPQETIETLKEYAALLPDGLSASTESLVDIIKEIEVEEKEGIKFTGQEMPEPAMVIEDA